MKIALLTSCFLPEVNGVTMVLWERLKCLSKTKHQVLLFCPDYQLFSDIYPNWATYQGRLYPNIEVVNLPAKPLFGLREHPTLSSKALSLITKKLDEFQPDIIHSDDTERMYLGTFFRDYGAKYAKKHSIPCIAMYHTNFIQYMEDYAQVIPVLKIPFVYNFLKYFILRTYTKYDLTLVSSKVISHYVQSMGVRRVYCDQFNGVDTERFHPQKRNPRLWLEKFGLPDLENKVIVLNVGRFSVEKGWPFILESLPDLAKAIGSCETVFLFAGYGEMEEEIVKKFSAYFPAYSLGRQPYEELAEIYASSSIFFTAGDKEVKSLAILEANSSGIPIIAPRAGGNIESVEEGISGYLYTPKDRNEFVEKFAKLIKDKSLQRNMSINARSFAEKMSWSACFKNWISVLEHLSGL